MLLEAMIIRILCAKDYDHQFWFLHIIEDYTADTFFEIWCKKGQNDVLCDQLNGVTADMHIIKQRKAYRRKTTVIKISSTMWKIYKTKN